MSIRGIIKDNPNVFKQRRPYLTLHEDSLVLATDMMCGTYFWWQVWGIYKGKPIMKDQGISNTNAVRSWRRRMQRTYGFTGAMLIGPY